MTEVSEFADEQNPALHPPAPTYGGWKIGPSIVQWTLAVIHAAVTGAFINMEWYGAAVSTGFLTVLWIVDYVIVKVKQSDG